MRQHLLLLALILAAPAGASQRPNVVLMVADDQAWTDFGFTGHEANPSPRLDELAAQGLVFPNGHVPSALCRPSLMTLATGLYPHEHGVTGNDPPKGVPRALMLERIRETETVPQLLAAAGYRCLQTGKWWEGSYAEGGFTEGMTHGEPGSGGRHGDLGLSIGRETMQPVFEFIDDCAAQDTPFFVWYAPFLPHRPHNPPERLIERFRSPERAPQVARYLAMCAWFDESCGALLDHLDERELARDTLVVLVSDNGWIQRTDADGYAPRSKRSSYEGGVRTPIVLRWPARVAPDVQEPPVGTIDLAPTILAACGVQAPARLSGVDLLAEPGPRPVFGARFTHDLVDLSEPARSCLDRWVIDGGWKLISPTGPGQPELYSIERDPHELSNLAGSEPAVVTELTRRLDGWWSPSPDRRRNVLLIVTDDQRADALGCAGHPFLRTPNLDRLAAEGVRFTESFVTTAICAANRACLLTSRREGRHGFTFGTPPLAAAHTDASYPLQLRAAGFRTGFVGKWGMRTEIEPRGTLFDEFRPLSPPYLREEPDARKPHLTERTASAGVAFLEASATDERPFCLTVSFNAPHAEDSNPAQYVPPPDLAQLYADVEIPPPPLSEPAFFESLPEFQRESMNRERWTWRFEGEAQRQQMTKDYYRMIAGVDRAVGRLLEALERLDLADETVVIFTSDNGYFLGERGFAGKWTIHEPSIRVPLIVRDPLLADERRGTTCDAMCLGLDVPATVLDAAHVARPASYEGHSLLPLTGGEALPWRNDFLFEHRFDHPQIPKSVGVRGPRWVYARYYEQAPVYEELYDLGSDPLEAHNLALDPAFADVLAEQRRRCDELEGS